MVLILTMEKYVSSVFSISSLLSLLLLSSFFLKKNKFYCGTTGDLLMWLDMIAASGDSRFSFRICVDVPKLIK